MKAYKKTVSRSNLYKQFLVLTNSLLNLTDRELELLSLLVQIQMEQQPLLGKTSDILSTDNRRLIMQETRINKNNMSKYIATLKRLKVLLEDENGHYINDMFVPDIKEGAAEILFVLDIKED